MDQRPVVGVIRPGATAEEQADVVELLEQALEEARSGVIRDVALVLARHSDQGPMFTFRYCGEHQYAAIVAGTAALAFDLQYTRADEGRE